MTEILVQKHSMHKEIVFQIQIQLCKCGKEYTGPSKTQELVEKGDTVAEYGILDSTEISFQLKMIGQVSNLWLTKFQIDRNQDIQTRPTRVIRRLG